MASYAFVYNVFDLIIAWVFCAFTIYSAYDLCVYLPLAPLITIGLELGSLLLAWSIIYIPKLIKNKIYPSNIQKKLSKNDKIKLITQYSTNVTPRTLTHDNSFQATPGYVNASELNTFPSVPRHNSSPIIDSGKCKDTTKPLFGNTNTDFNKTQGNDLESNPSFTFPIEADSRLIRREYTDPMIYHDIQDTFPSKTHMTNNYKRYKKTAHNRTFFTHNYRALANKALASKDKVYNTLSFLADVNLWIKMNILFPLVNSSVWVVADITITSLWCLLWQWAATFMKRNRGDVSLLTWKFDDVPKFYWYLEAGFHCSAVFHYCIMLYYSNSKIKQITSFNGIIEFITTPCVSFILGVIYQTNPDQNENEHYLWLMLAGSIRCLRLLRIESLIYKSFNWLSEVRVIIVGVITDFLSLLLAFSSIIFLLESNIKSNLFERPFDFFYLGVVTIGTVGYGDFAPITTVGRIIVIIVILTSITMGSIQLKRLREAMGSNSKTLGILPTASDKYVVYWGPLFPSQLLAICRSLEASYEDCINSIVVLTNLPIEDYKNVYLAINKNTDIKICVRGGSSDLITPSCIADILLYSKMTVIVNELSVLHDNLLGHDDSIVSISDQDAILRLTSIIRYTNKLKIPLAIQISTNYYSSYLERMNFYNVICILDLKNAFLAKSVLCKGLFYLIMSLYFIPHDMDRAKSYVQYCSNCLLTLCDSDEKQRDPDSKAEKLDNKMFSMLKGMQFQLFRMPFAPCMRGVKFGDLVGILHSYNDSVLIGVIQQDGSGFLRPWDYVIGQELDYQTEPFCGVVIANSIDEIIDMASLQQLPGDLVHHNDDSNKPIDALTKPIQHETVEEIAQDSNEGYIEVNDYNEAIDYFKNDGPFIIVCGWPSSLDDFLSYIMPSSLNVIILAPNKRKLSPKIPGRIAYIQGVGLLEEDLIKSGLLQCYSLIILCCNHFTTIQTSAYNYYSKSKNERSTILMSYDHQALFIRNVAYQILEREKNKVDLASINLIDRENCHIITEINRASSVEFFDVTFSTSVAALTSLGVAQKIWDNSSEFLLSLQVTTGSVFLKEMLYGLLAHSTSICHYAIDPNYIYTLLGVNRWQRGGNKQRFVMEQHIKHGMTNGSISLVKVPENMIGKSFTKLFAYMLINDQSICIGIYRSYSIKFKKFRNGIIIAYPQNLTMQKTDEIYIIS